MQVFRINNTKNETVTFAKVRAWWHFVIRLHGKIEQHFATVSIVRLCSIMKEQFLMFKSAVPHIFFI